MNVKLASGTRAREVVRPITPEIRRRGAILRGRERECRASQLLLLLLPSRRYHHKHRDPEPRQGGASADWRRARMRMRMPWRLRLRASLRPHGRDGAQVGQLVNHAVCVVLPYKVCPRRRGAHTPTRTKSTHE